MCELTEGVTRLFHQPAVLRPRPRAVGLTRSQGSLSSCSGSAGCLRPSGPGRCTCRCSEHPSCFRTRGGHDTQRAGPSLCAAAGASSSQMLVAQGWRWIPVVPRRGLESSGCTAAGEADLEVSRGCWHQHPAGSSGRVSTPFRWKMHPPSRGLIRSGPHGGQVLIRDLGSCSQPWFSGPTLGHRCAFGCVMRAWHHPDCPLPCCDPHPSVPPSAARGLRRLEAMEETRVLCQFINPTVYKAFTPTSSFPPLSRGRAPGAEMLDFCYYRGGDGIAEAQRPQENVPGASRYNKALAQTRRPHIFKINKPFRRL